MSDLELREFRAHAEELVDLPDLAELEGRGRQMHRRRIALGAGLAAVVLAGYSTRTPPEIRKELEEIVDSIEIVDPE